MLLDRGDSILVDHPTYTGALSFLHPMGLNLIGIPTDKEGLIPHKLEATLKDWTTNPKTQKFKKPKVLYTIVTGHNPSGSTMTLARKKELMAIANQFDLIILEDDPYRYLEFGKNKAPPIGQDSKFSRPQNISLWSLDPNGRVLRFDSLSKVLSSGMRIGVVSGNKHFVNQINLTTQATNLHSSGVSQILALKLFQHWGLKGWKAHCDQVALFYARRRDVFMSVLEKHLKGLAEWDTPTAGMFTWIKLLGIENSKILIEDKARKAKVILLPGEVFNPNGEISQYVRASFSLATDQEMDTAIERLATLLKEEKNKK
jgi:kynurenine/2-aminoadipate aminotransferase